MSPKNRVSGIGTCWLLCLGLLLVSPMATAQIQFSNPTSHPVGTAPVAAAVGDFNGDGKPDLAVVNSGSGDVSILLGNGDGTFQPAVKYPAGASPSFIAVGDLNGDGKLDLAVANGSANTVSVLLGNGDGTFQPPVQYSVGSSADFVAVADFNGDKKLDLLASSGGSQLTLSILLSNGDATFQPTVITSVPAGAGWGVSALAGVADFNGDGQLDVALVEGSGDIEHIGGGVIILLGKGDGTFQPAATFPIADLLGPSNVATGDFNRDGKADLAVSALTGIFIMLGNGDGTFSLAPNPQKTHGGYGFADSSLAVADMNGDGKLDLIALNVHHSVSSGFSTVEWGLGNVDGTFQGPLGNVNPCIQSSACLPLSFAPSWLALGDFNGDTLPDLAVTNSSANSVDIFLNDTPTFSLSLTVAGNGGGAVTSQPAIMNCKSSCIGNFAPGTMVTLTAAPSATSNFAGWSGACSGTGPCSATMSAATSVTATFTLQDFSLSPASTKLTLQPGAQGTDVMTIAGLNGPFGSAIHLTCAVAGPAPMPTCALAPTSMTPGANSVTSTLTITAPAAAATLAPADQRRLNKSLYALWLPLMFGITVVGGSKKLRRRYWAFCGLLLLLLFLLTACGGGNSSGSNGTGTPQPTNYTVTITSTSGAIQHTTQVTVTVQ